MTGDPYMTGGVDHGHPVRRSLGRGISSPAHFVTDCTYISYYLACRDDGHVAGLNLSHQLGPELDRKYFCAVRWYFAVFTVFVCGRTLSHTHNTLVRAVFFPVIGYGEGEKGGRIIFPIRQYYVYNELIITRSARCNLSAHSMHLVQ